MSVLKGLAIGLAGGLALLVGLALAALAAGAGATALIAARVESRFPPAGRTVPVRGGSLAVLEAGEGGRGTVVLLHGASANGADPMEGIGRLLAGRGFRVLAFDRPGYGWSGRLGGPEAASPAFQAGAIAEALAVMGVGPALVLGHSWSGALALRLALDHPERVAGLVLAAPVALPPPERPLPWWARLLLQPGLRDLLVHTLAVPAGRYYLEAAGRAAFGPQPMPDDYLARSRAALILRTGPARANIEDLIGLPAALREQAPRYGEIRVPSTIVVGDADAAAPPRNQAVPLAQAILGARLVRLPGIGHMLHYVAAEAVADAAEAVLARAAEPDAR